MRYATFSLFLHMMLLVILGGVVLYRSEQKADAFVAGGGELFAPTDSLAPVPDAVQEKPTLAEVKTPDAALDAPSMSVLTTTAMQGGFQVKANVNMSTLGDLSGADGMVKSLGDGKALSAGLGSGGGMGGGRMGSGFFGSKKMNQTGALVGRFYDLKQTRTRKPSGVSPDEYHRIFRKFVSEGWNPGILNDYFRAPKPLYSTQIMIPNMSADEGPKAFDMDKEVQPSRWLVHYTAKVSPPESGRYRFVGAGDDVMVVRFNRKVVLDRCWYQADQEWSPKKNYDYGWTGIPNGFAQGDAIDVREGEWYDLEILIGEQPGGLVFACLLMEKEGEEYTRDAKGNPILPVFRLADMAMPELQPGQTLPPYFPTGPIWKAAPAAK